MADKEEDYADAKAFITKVLEEKCSSYCCDDAEERQAIAEAIVNAVVEAGLLEPEDVG